MSVDGVVFDTMPGRSGVVLGYSDEVQAAMKLLEPLIQRGLIAVCPDRWMGGNLTFLPPRIAAKQGWSVHVPDLHVDRWALMPVTSEAVQSELVTEYRAADPLGDAIEVTARLMRDEVEQMVHLKMPLGPEFETTPLHRRLQRHFDDLLTVQMDRINRGG